MQHQNLPPHQSSLKRAILLAVSCLALPVYADDSPALFAFLSPAKVVAAAVVQEDSLAVHELPATPEVPGAIDLTAPTDDLWVRLRNGFSMPNLDNDLVLQHQRWYQSRPEYLRRMVERSRRYMHHIVEELEKRGMPTELALLPMVESAFNPMALSRSQAAGLWQFIPSTGKTYRLEQNWWQDQRRDILASTNAALDYLQTIYEMHGDWHLALASYNWGEGAVKRAIQKNEARGLPTDYSSLSMPSETRNYVPKLQALKNIFSNPKLMVALKIPALDNRPYFATVESSRPMDVKTAAKLAAMPLDEFVALNPSHNRPVIKADTPLVIPADKIETFQSNLESHDEPLASWQAYTLKPGDRLDKVAPRFGISLSDLKRINGLQGRLKIAAGSTLLVPSKGDANLDDIAAQPRLPEISAQQPPAPSPKVAAGKAGRKIAKVEKGNSAKLAKAEKTKGTKVAKADKSSGRANKVATAERKGSGSKTLAKSGGEKKRTVAARPGHASAKMVRADASRRA